MRKRKLKRYSTFYYQPFGAFIRYHLKAVRRKTFTSAEDLFKDMGV